MRILNLAFSILFFLSAVLQYNDPDPYIWIPIYLFGAVLCFMAYRRIFYTKAYLAGIAVFGLYAIYLFFAADGVADWLMQHEAENIAESMQAKKPWIEATREFFGLVILMSAMIINYYYARRKYIGSGRTTID